MRKPVLVLWVLLLTGCTSTIGVDREAISVVPILYATDRAATGSDRPNDSYGADQGDLTFGSADVSIPDGHRLGFTESPDLRRIEISEDPTRHIVLSRVEPIAKGEFAQALRERLDQGEERSILIFVHGYNVDFAKAARRMGQIAHDLNWRGMALLYSWPSGGRLDGYPSDSRRAQLTSGNLAETLTLLVRETGADSIHLLAHSIGSLPTLIALAQLAAAPSGKASPLLGELILAAPDVEAEQFRSLLVSAAPMAERVTVYVSQRDEVLQLSGFVNRAARAGDGANGVVAMRGVDTIDTSAVDSSLLGHSYYGGNRTVLADIFSLLTTRAPPERRFGLQAAASDGLSYWVIRP